MRVEKTLASIVILSGIFCLYQSTNAIALAPSRTITPQPNTTTTSTKNDDVTSSPKIEVNVIKTNLEINDDIDKMDPQPEPPMNQVQEQERQEMKIMLQADAPEESGEIKNEPKKIMVLNNLNNGTSSVEIIPNENSLMARFEHNKNTINIPVRVNIEEQGAETILKDGTATYTLKMNIPEFYSNLSSAIEKLGLTSTSLKNIELTVQNKKPVYNTTIEQKAKLFGLFPIKLNKQLQIHEDGTTTETKSQWYHKFFTGLIDISKLKFTANIAVTKLEIDPQDFKAGEMVKIKATLKNTGNSMALSVPGLSGSGSTLKFFGENQYLGGYAVPIALNAGESKEYEYTWKNAICGAQLKVEFTTGKIEGDETGDNTLIAIAKCAE